MFLIVLRVTIGWHFLYEGVWKIANPDKFSTTPLLAMAKGPAAPLFYAMVYDIDGRERLTPTEAADGELLVTGAIYTNAWKGQCEEAAKKYKLDEEQQKTARALLDRYVKSAQEYLTDNREEIVAYLGSLDRYEAALAAGGDNSAYKKKRNWDQQQKLRGEANAWLAELDGMGDDYRAALWDVLSDGQKQLGPIPSGWTRADLMDYAITYSLAAIGLCMMLGFCNRLACLGGAAFLVSVLLTQPPWPTIYPPAPAMVGHALIVDKNFVEMVAMLALACLPVGRWGGLDFFVYKCIGRPLMQRFGLVVR